MGIASPARSKLGVRIAFRKSLDVDHDFLLAAGTVSWIVNFQCPGLFFRNRYSKFRMNEWNGVLLGRTAHPDSYRDEVPNPLQPFLQDMHRKPADKLQIVQTHLQLLGSLTIVFVAKGDLFLANVQDAVIGDGHLVGVPAQVFQHGFGMTKWTLGVHDPVFLEELIDQFLLRFDPGLDCFHILGTEHFAHRSEQRR